MSNKQTIVIPAGTTEITISFQAPVSGVNECTGCIHYSSEPFVDPCKSCRDKNNVMRSHTTIENFKREADIRFNPGTMFILDNGDIGIVENDRYVNTLNEVYVEASFKGRVVLTCIFSKGQWLPLFQDGSKYFFITSTGVAKEATWRGSSQDKVRLYLGNVFSRNDIKVEQVIAKWKEIFKKC